MFESVAERNTRIYRANVVREQPVIYFDLNDRRFVVKGHRFRERPEKVNWKEEGF